MILLFIKRPHIIFNFKKWWDASEENLSYNKVESKGILGGVDMAITIQLPDTAASHAKPSMEMAILCVR
ncbi:hypothetical protein [Bacillus pseudomycoides]